MLTSPPMADNGLYIGLMSGTSLDGVDGVIVDKHCKKIIASVYQPYPPALKKRLRTLIQKSNTSLKNLSTLDIAIAAAFAQAANQLLQEARLPSRAIKALGSHGQTIYHQGGQYSMQIGHGAIIAQQTGIITVADFRMNDVAAGGQGAPLTPAYHQHMLGNKAGIVVNLGGIANITLVQNTLVSGFDTGPANTLLDAWIQQEKNLDYDKYGAWARSGTLDKALLKNLLADAYFHDLAPKSTGVEYFNLDWLAPYLSGNESSVDVQRTLLELTAISISQHLVDAATVYLCGGGVHNLFLTERLVGLNPHNKITTTDDLGVGVDYVEAAAFAFFAKQALAGKPSSLPAVTGVKNHCVLGAIYQAHANKSPIVKWSATPIKMTMPIK